MFEKKLISSPMIGRIYEIDRNYRKGAIELPLNEESKELLAHRQIVGVPKVAPSFRPVAPPKVVGFRRYTSLKAAA